MPKRSCKVPAAPSRCSTGSSSDSTSRSSSRGRRFEHQVADGAPDQVDVEVAVGQALFERLGGVKRVESGHQLLRIGLHHKRHDRARLGILWG